MKNAPGVTKFSVKVIPPPKLMDITVEADGSQVFVSVGGDCIFRLSPMGMVTFYKGDAEKCGLRVGVIE